jgi:hypothetical protein
MVRFLEVLSISLLIAAVIIFFFGFFGFIVSDIRDSRKRNR